MNNSVKGFLIGAIAATTVTSAVAISQVSEAKDDLKKAEINLDYCREDYNKALKTIDEKTKQNNNMKKELHKISKEKEELQKQKEDMKKELARRVNFELTYYTDLPQENGGYTKTKYQTPLRYGVVASNHYARGTKIKIGGQVFTVEDTGSSEFNSPNRLDVLVERQPGESDDQYLNRVNNIGRTQVKGVIL